MRRYPSPRGPARSSRARGVEMMPGLIALIRAPRLPHRMALAMQWLREAIAIPDGQATR